MGNISRRRFLELTAGTIGVSVLGIPMLGFAAKQRVVIVGGGIGGATAAKYIRMADPDIELVLIEPKQHYHTCFMSNEVLSGERDMETIKFSYDGLRKHNIEVIHDLVIAIDPITHKITLKGGQQIVYAACVVSPGIDFKWDTIEGYDASVAELIPHAWQAGPQTALLRKQLITMRDGGTVIIAAPPNPFRCPPGPYERASQIAWYLKHHKAKSKILILDPKPKFSKQGLFTEAWERHYGFKTNNSLIDWVSGPDGGAVTRLDAKRQKVFASSKHKGEVLNIIPAQQAGKIAFSADLVDESGWCPVNHQTFESKKYPDIYVIGDASTASPMPKSGYAANSQAKVCAAAVVAKLRGEPMPIPSYINTCYSLITPEEGVSVAMVYKLGSDGMITNVEGAGGLTAADSTYAMRKREVAYAYSWFKNITEDTFG